MYVFDFVTFLSKFLSDSINSCKKKRSCEQIVDGKPGNFRKIIHYAKKRDKKEIAR